MAQLRYAKAVACGTALTAAGLAGYYLYTRNNLKKAKMKDKDGEEELVFFASEENVGKGTQAIEERLRQEAEQEKASEEGTSKKYDCKDSDACTSGCTPDIEAIEKVLEKLSEGDTMGTPNENENLDKDRHVEDSIENVVNDFMMECSMDTNASSGSSLNVSNEHIVEDLQALDEAIPTPVQEVMVSSQPQPVQETIAPTKRQTFESSAPPLDNANRKGPSTNTPSNASFTNGNILDNQKTNAKGGRKNKMTTNSQTNFGKGTTIGGKKGNKKGNDLSKLQSVDWASSVLLEEKSHGSVTSPLGTNESNSTGCDVSSEVNSEGSSIDSGHGSRDSGASASPAAIPQTNAGSKDGPVMYQFEFPSKLCGRLIGKSGKNIRELKDKTGARVVLKNIPYSNTHQICVVEGLKGEVDGALAYIKKKFPSVDLSRRANTQQPKKNKTPDMTQLQLPEEVPNNVLISSVVSGGHIFIQQPVHPTFTGLGVQDSLMTQIYQQADMTPQLPRPIENGVICAAPVMDGWYRAQVVEVGHETDEVDVRFLDYGGYARLEGYTLRQIRSDFLALPFQATECYMSNIAPLPGDADFSEACRIYVEQLAQSIGMMQASITGYSVDGIPFIEIFFMDSYGKSQSLNKQLVNQGLVSWYEGAEAAEPSPNAALPPLTSALYSSETSVRPS